MDFTTATHNGFTYLRLAGTIQGGPEAMQFHDFINERLADESKTFIINLQAVDYVSSAGLGMLLAAQTRVQGAGGRMLLCHAGGVNVLLSVIRLQHVFATYLTEAEACAAVNAPLPEFGSATS